MPRSRLHLATAHFLALGIAAWPAAAHAQSAQASASSPSSRIYRCGNAYTNDVAEAQARGCRLLEGGNVTVVQGTKVQAPAPRAAGGQQQRLGGLAGQQVGDLGHQGEGGPAVERVHAMAAGFAALVGRFSFGLAAAEARFTAASGLSRDEPSL